MTNRSCKQNANFLHMKHILFFILLFISAPVFGQTLYTTGVTFCAGVPVHNPGTTGAKWALDTTTWNLYVRSYGTTWTLIGNNWIQNISGCAAPAYTPTKHQSKVVINACDPPELYAWDGAAWDQIGAGSGGLTGTGLATRIAAWTASGALGYDVNMVLDTVNNRMGVNEPLPARTLDVEGEARISDLTTDTPTRLIGADADGDLGDAGSVGSTQIPYGGGNYLTSEAALAYDATNDRLTVGTGAPTTAWINMPSAINKSGWRVGSMEAQSFGSLNNVWIADNIYYDGAFKYRQTGPGALFYFESGGFDIRTTPSGTAGNNATLTQRIIVSNTGQVTVAGQSVFLPGGAALTITSGANNGLVINKNSTTNIPITLSVSASGANNIFQTAYNSNLSSGQDNILLFGKAGSTNNSGYIKYVHSADGSATANRISLGFFGNDDKATLYTSGNMGLGISTATPAARLDVRGSGATSATSALDVANSNDTTILLVRNDGRVGIHTGTPDVSFDAGDNTDAIKIPSGTTAQEPAVNNTLRFNTDRESLDARENGVMFRLTSSKTPSIAAGAAAGTGPTIAVAGNDLSMKVTLTTGTTATTGALFTVTYASSMDAGVTNYPVFSCADADCTGLNLYVSAESNTAFTISTQNAPTDAVQYIINIHIGQ